MKNKTHFLNIEGWHLEALVDDDGHLNVAIKHDDKTEVSQCDVDFSADEGEWTDRFTTEAIEKEYQKSLEDDQFLCIQCLKANDIEDSIETPNGLVCDKCQTN